MLSFYMDSRILSNDSRKRVFFASSTVTVGNNIKEHYQGTLPWHLTESEIAFTIKMGKMTKENYYLR